MKTKDSSKPSRMLPTMTFLLYPSRVLFLLMTNRAADLSQIFNTIKRGTYCFSVKSSLR